MSRHRIRLHFIFGIAGLVGALASGCGDDDSGNGGDPGGGDAGDSSTTGGKSTGSGGGTSSGGKSTSGGTNAAGETGEGGDAGTSGGKSGSGGSGGDGSPPGGGSGGDDTGEGGAPPVPSTADVDDVIGSVCEWEFRCCDEGERTYRLSPFADDADDCAERLIYELRESNATANPYLSGPAAPGNLLGTLAYVVDLDRVEIDAAGAAECVASWSDADCAEPPDANARCTGETTEDPCALTNLFRPKLALGDECTPALTETGSSNDVECVEGSTCLPAGHADNPNDVPTCVKRGLSGDPCTADDDCDFDLFCNSGGDCEEKADIGEDCSFEDPDQPVPGEEDVRCKAGLSCHPVDLECVAPCTLGFTCAGAGADADAACPEGSGCAPLAVGESEAEFRVCTPLGSSPSALCNSDADCVETYHCETRTCQPDRMAPTACTSQNQCAEGLHCDVGGTGQCIAHLAPMSACTEDFQCGPGSAGCVNTGSGGVCRNSLLADGDACGEPAACQSGLCELATGAATAATCVPGAGEGSACDADLANGNAQSCRPGFGCIGGICVAQVGPGGDCSPTAGMPNAALCANASVCEDPWMQGGEICTDAPVPASSGGSGLTCDGE